MDKSLESLDRLPAASELEKLEEEIFIREREILQLENDDTVGHTWNGRYFTRLRQIRRQLSDLTERREALK